MATARSVRQRLNYARFSSLSAVAADANGVHVVWNARNAAGQAKVFARNSPDGLTWTDPAVALDPAATGHQFFPDIATDGGTLSVVLQDSRRTRRTRPTSRPETRRPGPTPATWSTPFVATLHQRDGLDRVAGQRRRHEPELGGPRQDALAVLRRLQLRVGPAELGRRRLDRHARPRARDRPARDRRTTTDGFDGAQTCTWVPDDIYAPPTARRRSPIRACHRAASTRTSTWLPRHSVRRAGRRPASRRRSRSRPRR